MRRCAPLLSIVLGVVACDQPKKPAPVEQSAGARVELVGIDPERWTCDRVASKDAVSAAVGGHVREVEGTLPPPRGTPRPCNYLVEAAVPEAWTFDLDCRPGALRTAERLWKQYLEVNGELLAAYGDAGPDELQDDAGVVHAAPGAPSEVAVGAKGLDHNGQAVLFIDDDTPCYGRVVGPDPVRRLALAQLVAKNLSPATAPMDPHPAGK